MNETVRLALNSNYPVMVCIKENSLLLQDYLKQQGYFVGVANLSEAEGELAVFRRLVSSLPNGKNFSQICESVNLNAFGDFMIDALLSEGKIALLVENSDFFIENYANLVLSLNSIIISQSIRMKGRNLPFTVVIFLLGEGKNFTQGLHQDEGHKPPQEEKFFRSREQREMDRREHLEKMRRGELAWQRNMTDEQQKHMKKILKNLPETSSLTTDGKVE
ncbi:hypothetical protein IAD21_03806 [Abditibacteriota bacterium]|nr:hypothetical protein IAD21_03806 [Abditibacteriota bacterium]